MMKKKKKPFIIQASDTWMMGEGYCPKCCPNGRCPIKRDPGRCQDIYCPFFYPGNRQQAFRDEFPALAEKISTGPREAKITSLKGQIRELKQELSNLMRG